MRTLLLSCALFFLPITSFADGITVDSVGRVSAYSEDTNGDFAIFGGVAGGLTDGCAAASATSTCNNCGQTNIACNESRIHDSLLLQITFTVDDGTDITNQVLDVEIKTSGGGQDDLSLISGSGSYSNNDTVTFTVLWSEVCDSYDATAGLGAGCEEDSFKSVISIKVGTAQADIDVTVHDPKAAVTTAGNENLLDCTDGTETTADGICHFHAYPGDEKIYYTDISLFNQYPNNGNVRFTGIRVFISTTTFADANYTAPLVADITLPVGQDEPEPNIIDGLTNETYYVFRSAMIDEANNIAFLQHPNSIDNIQVGCDAVVDPGTLSADDLGCDMIARPSAVFGLLNDELNCFISTAAYGSRWTSNVQTFRKFRSRFLSGNPVGEKFIKWYYKHGAIAANYIAENESLKTITRAALLPFLWFAEASLKYGIIQSFLGLMVLLILIATSFGGIVWWRKQRA